MILFQVVSFLGSKRNVVISFSGRANIFLHIFLHTIHQYLSTYPRLNMLSPDLFCFQLCSSCSVVIFRWSYPALMNSPAFSHRLVGDPNMLSWVPFTPSFLLSWFQPFRYSDSDLISSAQWNHHVQLILLTLCNIVRKLSPSRMGVCKVHLKKIFFPELTT